MFAVLLLLLGARRRIDGNPATTACRSRHYSWRGPLFVSAAIVFFALAIRPLGLVVSAFAAFLIAAIGSHETRWIEAIIVGACLTAGLRVAVSLRRWDFRCRCSRVS